MLSQSSQLFHLLFWADLSYLSFERLDFSFLFTFEVAAWLQYLVSQISLFQDCNLSKFVCFA